MKKKYRSVSFEDRIVKYCRRIFKNKYNNYWIDTLNKEVSEVKNKYKIVEVHLYPKTINLREELIKRGITPPPKLRMRKPKKPRKRDYKNYEYNEALSDYKIKLNKYKELKEKNDRKWEKFRGLVYDLIHEDIDYNKRNDVVPIKLKIKKIVESRWSAIKSDQTGRPSKILVELSDGTQQWYRR